MLGGVLLATLAAPPVHAQYATRAEKIQAEQEKKKKELKPEESPKGERILNAVKEKKVVERLVTGYHGLTLVLGGLATGQGFALGPQYKREHLADGKLSFRTSARYSFANAYLLDAELALPRLANRKLSLEFYGLHRNLPRMDYYGPGPDSEKSDRTHYRLEDTLVEGRLILKPVRPLQLGITGGLLRVNTGPGNRAPEISRAEDVFTPTLTTGLDRQTDFLQTSAFIQFDYRDNPGGPRSGGLYLAKITYFDDIDLEQHDHRQLHFEVQQYFPFFNKRRVIALRGLTRMSLRNGAGSTVPFYLQPYLGGPNDLRGYRAYRFYDDNQILVNLEYRWEAFTGLDMAIFADAGKVVPKRSQINFHDLESAVGFGLRFNVLNRTFMRIDTGYSHEGFQVWLKFGNAF